MKDSVVISELEIIRIKMVNLFYEYKNLMIDSDVRELIWLQYVAVREKFLKVKCKTLGIEYKPLSGGVDEMHNLWRR